MLMPTRQALKIWKTVCGVAMCHWSWSPRVTRGDQRRLVGEEE